VASAIATLALDAVVNSSVDNRLDVRGVLVSSQVESGVAA